MNVRIFTLVSLILAALTLLTYSQENGKSTYTLALGQQFNVIENKLYFSSDMRFGDKVFISDLKGKKIFGYIHELDISKIKLPKITPGIYVVSRLRNGRLINKNQVVMGVSSK